MNFIMIYGFLKNILVSFQIGDYKNHNYSAFGFLTFLFMFKIFCVYVAFQVYKQSKHEYRIKLGFAPEDNINGNNDENNENLINDNNFNDEDNNNIEGNNNANNNNNEDNNVNNNQDEFAPLQSNGIPAEGN